MPRKTDKRVRLIEAAKLLMHRKGFNETTLADIAQEADVPLGNVYYYFKTKDAIGEAVVEKRAAESLEFLLEIDKKGEPKQRLLALLQLTHEELEEMVRYGCSIGGLCQELGKQGGTLADQAAKLLHDLLAWCETQFRALGFNDKSTDLALNLVASIQGMYLLTHTFRDPQLAVRQSTALQEWLEKTVATVKSAAVRPVAELA
jgi:TetR/AcrR family transcriptional repressor of nem operon